MTTLPVHFRGGHIFIEIEANLWLFDTGAPSSFGRMPELIFCGVPFSLGGDFLGLTADSLSEFVSETCAGLLGADVLGHFDFVLDLGGQTLTVSDAELQRDGIQVDLDFYMGIPLILVRTGNSECRMFFDTGAQYSYCQHANMVTYPDAGSVTDFYPGFGRFETQTKLVPAEIGGAEFELRFGAFPEILEGALLMAGTGGIIGNELVRNRPLGYFPRRNRLVL